MSGGIKMGNNRFDLLSLGEILLRLSPPDNERIVSGETFQKQVGGAELNVVSGVSILGLRTGVVSKLPDNALGIYAKDKVRFCGVSDDFLVYDDSQDARLGIYYYAGTEKIESLFHDWLCLLNGYILFINSFDLYVGRFRQVFVQVEIHTYKNDYG